MKITIIVLLLIMIMTNAGAMYHYTSTNDKFHAQVVELETLKMKILENMYVKLKTLKAVPVF